MKKPYSKVSVMAAIVLAAILVLAVGASGADKITAAPMNPEFESVIVETLQGSRELPRSASGHPLGYIPSPIDFRYLKAGGMARVQQALGVLVLPVKWDWRGVWPAPYGPGYNAVTPVKNQGNCGSCWAFGNMGAVESRYKISTTGHPICDLSEDNMISLDTTASRACHWPWLWGRCSGGNTDLATSYLTGLILRSTTEKFQKGALLETADTYNASGSYINPKCSPTSRPYPSYRINGTRKIYGDTYLMKQAIYKYGPMVSAFYYADQYIYSGYVYYNPHWFFGTNHEILIVGWDDSKAWPDGSGQGAWIVKNSWGTGWGLSGYFYICYGSAGVGDDSLSYSGVRPFVAKENFYAEDLGGWLTNVGWTVGGVHKTTGYGANVFKATVTGEKLTAVEIFAPFFNMPYTIKIWKTVTHPTASTVAFSTQLGTTITGKAAEPGYYEIAIPTPPSLTAGHEYGVEVKFASTANNYYWPIPCAVPISGVVAATAGLGNALTYSRALDTGSFTRVLPYLPNVRVRTLRP